MPTCNAKIYDAIWEHQVAPTAVFLFRCKQVVTKMVRNRKRCRCLQLPWHCKPILEHHPWGTAKTVKTHIKVNHKNSKQCHKQGLRSPHSDFKTKKKIYMKLDLDLLFNQQFCLARDLSKRQKKKKCGTCETHLLVTTTS